MERLAVKQTAWDLSALFAGDDDPKMEEKRKTVFDKSYAFINKWKDRSDYLEEPEILKEALDQYEKWQRSSSTDGDEGYYFWLRSSQDENDPTIKAKLNKIHESSVKIRNDIQFFELRVAKIQPELQQKFLEYDSLKLYRHFLERLFAESKYLLSEPEEKILNLKSAPAYSNWIKMTSGFLSKEEREILTGDGGKTVKSFSEIVSLQDSQKKAVRDSAAGAFNDILRKHVDAAEAEMNSILWNKKIDDELRGVERPDLMRHIADDIESTVVDALIEAVSRNLEVARKYYEFKAHLFGVPQLAYHERNVPYGRIDKTYSFDEAALLIQRVLARLDGKFAAIFNSFAENGRIDVFPRKNKCGGAFCAHNLLAQPTYILLNHTGRLRDVLTLAHELGHGINNELMRGKQNALNFGSPLSTAEVASTFVEDFVVEEIMREADDELKLALAVSRLDEEMSTIFRQAACYNFEKELHGEFREKDYLSKEEIGSLFQKHMVSYMGEAVEQSPGSENWWVYWGHIRTFFYVYSYSSGLLISKALQAEVRRNPDFMAKVKEFLSAGLSDSPRNIFLKLGIDIADESFWSKGIAAVEELLAETSDLAKKLGKI